MLAHFAPSIWSSSYLSRKLLGDFWNGNEVQRSRSHPLQKLDVLRVAIFLIGWDGCAQQGARFHWSISGQDGKKQVWLIVHVIVSKNVILTFLDALLIVPYLWLQVQVESQRRVKILHILLLLSVCTLLEPASYWSFLMTNRLRFQLPYLAAAAVTTMVCVHSRHHKYK